MRIISLGAGVQSSTLLLMALHGEFSAYPDCAIFADTGWERKATYSYLDFLMSVCDEVDFPLHTVRAGNLKQAALNAVVGAGRFATMPLFVQNPDGTAGMLWRQCTNEYKLTPIYQKIKELIGNGLKQAEVWLGISFDEVMRMKPARVKWVENRWPLIDRRLTRQDCVRWLSDRGYPMPPKSACIGCPFHDDATWREFKQNDPESWLDAVAFDKSIRHLPRIKGKVFLHHSLKALDEVDLETPEDKGQLNFINECEGMCGT